MMRYIVQRPLKVGDRMLQPGEELPDAAEWRNLSAYIASGHMVAVPESGASAARLDALEQRLAGLEARLAGVVIDEGETVTEVPGEDEGGEQSLAPAPQNGIASTHPNAPSPANDTPATIDLDDWRRPELNRLATRAGVANPEGLQNKDAVIAAIAEAVTPEHLAALVTGE